MSDTKTNPGAPAQGATAAAEATTQPPAPPAGKPPAQGATAAAGGSAKPPGGGGRQFADTRHFGSISTERVVEDPWGWGYRFKIRRTGCAGYQGFLKSIVSDGDNVAANFVRRLMAESAKEGGKRQRRKAKGRRALDDALIDRAADNTKLSASDLSAEELETLKPGLAEHLVVEWWGPAEIIDGEERPMPCTYENVLSWLQNRNDEDGNPFWVPEFSPDDGERIMYGGQPLGDAWADFLLSEADDQEAFHKGAMQRHRSDLVPGPAGLSGTGSR